MVRFGLICVLATFAGCHSSSEGRRASALTPRDPVPLDAGALWTALTPPTIASTYFTGSFVYDSAKKTLVYLTDDGPPRLFTSTDAITFNQVTNSGTVTWPGPLSGGNLVYDSKNDYVFALTSGGDGMDSLYWNATTNVWTTLSPVGTHPDGRPNYGAVYDPGDDLLLMYGGGDSFGGSTYSDLSSLDPNPADVDASWTPITLAGTPPGGPPIGIAWDAANSLGRFIGNDGDIYTFDKSSVTKTSATSLGYQGEGGIGCAGWDPGISRWVAFNVPDASNNSNNVYEHDDTNNVWKVISTGGFNNGMPNAGLPPAFQRCSLVWFPPLNGLVLIGLVNGSSGSMWEAFVYKKDWTASGPPTGGSPDMGTGGGGGGGGGGVGTVAPRLDTTQTYNHTSVVAQPWVPGFSGSQSSLPLVAGTPPFTVNVSAGGEPFQVDPNTLTITWVPASAGAKSITVTVSNSAGSTSMTLDVNVINTTLPGPSAKLTVSPTVGPAPLAVGVTLDGTPGSGATALKTLIDFGDGSSPSYVSDTTHAYARVAGYQVTGTFWQNDGQQAGSKFALAVTTAGGVVPPTVSATASPTDEMTVSFSAVATPGTNPVTYYSWDFGDGASATGQTAQHTFAGVGSYSVVVVATDSQSYWGSDKVLVVLNGGGSALTPTVRASAAPATGDGPLLVTLNAQTANVGASVSGITWDFGDGSTPAAGATLTSVQHTFNPGAYTVHLTVQTPSGNATDSVAVMVTTNGSLPPQIITVGGDTATVGMAYQYDADATIHARSEGPVSYSTGPGTPGGLRVDAASGAVTWTPAKGDVGTQRITLLATSAGGVDTQSFNVTVADSKKGGCAMAADGGAAPTGAWVLLLLFLAVARRAVSVSR